VDAVVDAENPPLRLLLSSLAYDIAQNAYTQRQQTWSEWDLVGMGEHLSHRELSPTGRRPDE
jgi:hypothetical protein